MNVYSNIIHNTQKVKTVQMSMSRQMDAHKVVYPYREYFGAIKRNVVLIQATKWINLKNIRLSKRSQSQNPTYYLISFL